MYSYTIQPSLRDEFARAQRKGWNSKARCSYVYDLVRSYQNQMKLPSANASYVFEQCMYVKYRSQTPVKHVPVCGYKIPVEFFVERKLK